MKAVIASVPEHILKWRRRTGADRHDEMWEGVLHMAPVPNREHQDLESCIEFWFRQHWTKPTGGRVYHQINVAEPGTWPDNYRVPDLVVLTPARFHVDCNEYFDGGPDVVVEIRSPDDESYEKFDFYAKVGVQEVWVIDRDTRSPEIYALVGCEYQRREANAEGWLTSDASGVELRSTANEKLEIRLAGQNESAALLP